MRTTLAVTALALAVTSLTAPGASHGDVVTGAVPPVPPPPPGPVRAPVHDSADGTPDRPVAVHELPVEWRRRFAVGATVGLGSPFGVLGAWGDVNVSRHLGFTVGGGYGTGFGGAFGVLVNVRPVTLGVFAPLLVTGFNFNVTPGDVRRLAGSGLTTPLVSSWWTAGIGFEMRFRGGFVLRTHFGLEVMLDTGDFTNAAVGPFFGPARNPLFFDPISAADAHDVGRAFVMPYLAVDLGYVLPYGV